MAIAGAVISIGYNGKCEISRGYVLPVDKAGEGKEDRSQD
jgi:hypothetical protein